MDGDALPDALGHRTKLFELGEYALGMFYFRGVGAELQLGAHMQNAHPSLRVAAHHSRYRAVDGIGPLLELAECKQQRIAQAIADGGAQQLHGRRPQASPQRRGLVAYQNRHGLIKANREAVVRLLLQRDRDIFVGHGELSDGAWEGVTSKKCLAPWMRHWGMAAPLDLCFRSRSGAKSRPGGPSYR